MIMRPEELKLRQICDLRPESATPYQLDLAAAQEACRIANNKDESCDAVRYGFSQACERCLLGGGIRAKALAHHAA